MATTRWQLDPLHSELGFKIRHLMIANVSGSFTHFDVEAHVEDEDFTTAQVSVRIDMSSINTHNRQRDEHLRNSDFFEVEKYPEAYFKSTRNERLDNDSFMLYGNLTMKGYTRPVQLKVEYSGVTKDPWGGERAGFVVTGKINRSDWGVNFNSVLDTGGVGLGEDVKILAEMQLVKAEVVAMAG